jgi:hypothetical protein
MRPTFLTILLLLLILCGSLSAQNTFKLFDAVPVTSTDPSVPWNPRQPITFATKEIFLSCPIGRTAQSYLTGPNGGNLIVDNFMHVNGANVCPDEWNCFAGVSTSPQTAVGQDVESVYVGVPSLDISGRINATGLYTFTLLDYGYNFGSSEIYLHTSCSTITQVCHRNNGRNGQNTLTLSPSALRAHLAHGDTEGPCAGNE